MDHRHDRRYDPPAGGEPPSGCPDANALAALVDGRLDGEKRTEVLAHLDVCETCFEVYVETLRFQRERAPATGTLLQFPGVRRLAPKILVPTAAAAVLALVFFRLPSADPPGGLGSYRLAVSALAARDAASALRFRLPAELDAGDLPRLGVRRGETVRCLDDHDCEENLRAAVDAFEAAVARDPDDLEARLDLFSAHAFAGRTADALAAARAAAALAPGDPRVREALTVAEYLFTAETGASFDARALAAAEPASAAAAYNRAMILTELGAPEAAAAWEEFLRLEPEGLYARRAREILGRGSEEENPP